MLARVVVAFTHNLAYGVFVGVLLAAMPFANKVAQCRYLRSELSEEGRGRDDQVAGQVCFASADKLVEFFDFIMPFSPFGGLAQDGRASAGAVSPATAAASSAKPMPASL